MSYLHEFDAWLEPKLSALEEEARASLKRDIKEKILESYRNGQRDCAKRVRGALAPKRTKRSAQTQSSAPRK